MKSKENLNSIKFKIIKILKKKGIVKAGIFGSFARGEQKKNSDIDILIKSPKDIGFEFAGIKLELEDELGIKVDLLTYKSIHPKLKKQILRDEVRII
ncbi:MAG: DNA polymerase beta protein [archaeon GW2011_AR13]|nr:MAG: DNA polymerase beta protein [archaeon GW2011_AR13]HIG94103.1 nucleotidyltransferase family protein [Nanoarchaeota archaeon]HIH63316.1 nucleotidyltransferase family protein [Nanoarchaeota archaeon]HIJ09955.1 nucleotidyltransferase family protein [Nanoarchaeota archaeon]